MSKRVQVIIDGVSRYDGTPETFSISENESGTFELKAGPRQAGWLEQMTATQQRRKPPQLMRHTEKPAVNGQS